MERDSTLALMGCQDGLARKVVWYCTCWVGVLGGAEKLSPVEELERRRLREFGYLDTDEEKPIIRLACQARAFGAVSIVIPPWNGIFGKYVEKQRQAATGAK